MMVIKACQIAIIIPVLNESQSIIKVIQELPAQYHQGIVVVDNGSTDGTQDAVLKAKITLVSEPKKGYGSACLRGLDHVAKQKEKPEIVVFLDGDYSDYPREIDLLLDPIRHNEADFVIGSRTRDPAGRLALTPQARFGNWLATKLIQWCWHATFTDLGPFRAIRYQSLMNLQMQDQTFGWTVEMQIRAVKKGLRIREVAVSYRQRIGKSKISGTVKGTVLAGYKILSTIFKEKFLLPE